ncbi:MAG: hypothetical protein LAP87_16765 [Acidobacteriia bacterium]|nr:hypothetical protein [Terriglobia bacterium]
MPNFRTLIIIVALIFAVTILLYSHPFTRTAELSDLAVVRDPQFGVVMKDEVLVFFSSTTTPAEIDSIVARVHGTVLQRSLALGMWDIGLPSSMNDTADNIKGAIRFLSTLPQVEQVTPNSVSSLP